VVKVSLPASRLAAEAVVSFEENSHGGLRCGVNAYFGGHSVPARPWSRTSKCSISPEIYPEVTGGDTGQQRIRNVFNDPVETIEVTVKIEWVEVTTIEELSMYVVIISKRTTGTTQVRYTGHRFWRFIPGTHLYL
jgi:hypothetical protein